MWNHQPVLAPIYLSSVMAASVADSSLDISNRQAAIYSYAAAEAATSIAQTMNSAASAVSSHKRPHDSSGPFQPRNRPSGRPAQGDLSQVQCFRCGNKGHIVSTCSSSTTIAGKPSLQIRTGSRGLLVDSASGKDICLKFNRNQCFDNSCPRAHLCPLDGQPHSIVDHKLSSQNCHSNCSKSIGELPSSTRSLQQTLSSYFRFHSRLRRWSSTRSFSYQSIQQPTFGTTLPVIHFQLYRFRTCGWPLLRSFLST